MNVDWLLALFVSFVANCFWCSLFCVAKARYFEKHIKPKKYPTKGGLNTRAQRVEIDKERNRILFGYSKLERYLSILFLMPVLILLHLIKKLITVPIAAVKAGYQELKEI